MARDDVVVGVISAHEDSDYLVFSNNGSLLRSHVSDISVRGRNAGYMRIKRIDEDEHIIGLQEIPPEVVAAIDESAEKRRLEAAGMLNDASEADTETQAAEKASAAADLDFEDGSEKAPAAEDDEL